MTSAEVMLEEAGKIDQILVETKTTTSLDGVTVTVTNLPLTDKITDKVAGTREILTNSPITSMEAHQITSLVVQEGILSVETATIPSTNHQLSQNLWILVIPPEINILLARTTIEISLLSSRNTETKTCRCRTTRVLAPL